MNCSTRLRSLALAVTLLACAALPGCKSGIEAGEVRPANLTAEQSALPENPSGLRYYLPSKYFVITQQANGQWDATIESVVDRSREFYVQPNSIFASGNTTVEFNDDGTLKSFKLVSKATEVPLAVVEALKTLELERERLRQEAIEAEKEKKKESKAPGAGRGSDGPPDAVPEESRSVYVFRINGDHLVGGADVGDPDARMFLPGLAAAPPTPPTSQPAIRSADSDAVEVSYFEGDAIVIVSAKPAAPLNMTTDADRFEFFTDLATSQQVSNGQRLEILEFATQPTDKSVAFRLADLLGVEAIGLK